MSYPAKIAAGGFVIGVIPGLVVGVVLGFVLGHWVF